MGRLVVAATKLEMESGNLKKSLQSRTRVLKENISSYGHRQPAWTSFQKRTNHLVANASTELKPLSLELRRLAGRMRSNGQIRLAQLDNKTRVRLSRGIDRTIEGLERAKRVLERNSRRAIQAS